MPPNPSQRSMIHQFMTVTGLPEKSATRLLKASNWKIEQASDSYFTSNGLAQSSVERSKESLEKMFSAYRGQGDDETTVGAEGTMRYFDDLNINIESAELLIPLEVCQVQQIGEMHKDGFVEGWKAVGCDTLSKQKAYVASQAKQLSTDMALFKRVYRYVFVCARERGAKALPLEAAIVYWRVLFTPPGRPLNGATTNWAEFWFEFLEAKWSKSVNKDMWNQTLEFLQKAAQDETLSFWNEDGAWPSVVDEFVVYAKEKLGISGQMETD